MFVNAHKCNNLLCTCTYVQYIHSTYACKYIHIQTQNTGTDIRNTFVFECLANPSHTMQMEQNLTIETKFALDQSEWS